MSGAAIARAAGVARSCAFALACASVGCGDKQQQQQAPELTAPTDAIRSTRDDGPVKVVVEVWPKAPNLGDPIHLRVSAETQDGIAIDLPFQEDALGRFSVTGYSRTDKRVADRRVQQADYELAAPSSGRHRIPPLRLELAEGKEILTDEVPLVIGTVSVARTDAEVSAPHDALPEVVGATPIWVWILAGAGALGGLFAVGAWWRGRGRRAHQVRITAYDAALRRLLALEASGPPEQGSADAWFVELSGIVRNYLEGRYEIRAPELTTEEFIQAAARSPELADAHRQLLSQFMDRCDRVKFAGYRPESEESLATLQAARGFLEDTRLRTEGK